MLGHRWSPNRQYPGRLGLLDGSRRSRVCTGGPTQRQRRPGKSRWAGANEFGKPRLSGDFRRKQPQLATGEFVRPAYPFRGRITADGSSGYPAVAGIDRAIRLSTAAAVLAVAGIAATLTANIAQGWSHGPVGAAFAAWPAVSLVQFCLDVSAHIYQFGDA
jgi:hypothetical protein